MKNYLFLDCDSTLSAIEGIDELARLKGPAVLAEVEQATNDAMDGKIAIEDIFARRLELIQPSARDCREVGQLYIDHMAPGLTECLASLRGQGWTPVIISGGFLPCIEPLAAELEIDAIEAVPLHFDASGAYAGFDPQAPTTRNGGKPEIIHRYRGDDPQAAAVMVGDGISDLECQAEVDAFVACLVFVERPAVLAASQLHLRHFDELPGLIRDCHQA